MTRFRANACLLLVALLWGLGNVAEKTVLEHIGPLTALGVRCLIGFFVVLPLARLEKRRHEGMPRPPASRFAWPTFLFCLALGTQHVAIAGTTVTNVGFLVNASVMFVPFVEWIVLKRRPRTATLVACAIAAGGVTLMTGGPGVPAWGDGVCLLSALLYSIWIVDVSKLLAEHARPFLLAAYQFASTGIAGCLAGLLFETVGVGALVAAAPELLFMGVLSTGVAYGIQMAVQHRTPPSDAVIVLSAECVFGAVAAAAMLGENPGPLVVAGAMAILVSIAIVSRPIKSLTGIPGAFRSSRMKGTSFEGENSIELIGKERGGRK